MSIQNGRLFHLRSITMATGRSSKRKSRLIGWEGCFNSLIIGDPCPLLPVTLCWDGICARIPPDRLM